MRHRASGWRRKVPVPVQGAGANALSDPVPEAVKQERLARFIEVQGAISRDKLQAGVGRRQIVLVDQVNDQRILTRGPADATEIDGNVIIGPEWELDPGDFVEVRITAAGEHDLWAEPVGD